MLIRSQNKEKLFSLEGFGGIRYGKTISRKEEHHKLYMESMYEEEIGEYETKERCLEIMDQIQTAAITKAAVYKMPER
mgnify:CR=1 FL=1